MSDKALFVMDMPDSCVDCIFCFEIDEGIEACCTIVSEQDDDKYMEIKEDYCQCKPDWCPLKPLPEKKICGYFSIGRQIRAYREGWNTCIDKILEGCKDETD